MCAPKRRSRGFNGLRAAPGPQARCGHGRPTVRSVRRRLTRRLRSVSDVVRPLAPVPVAEPLLAARIRIPVGLAARRWRRGAGLRLLVSGRRAGAGWSGRRRRRLLLRRLGVAARLLPIAPWLLTIAAARTDPRLMAVAPGWRAAAPEGQGQVR